MVALGMREEKAAPTDSIICLTHSGFRKYEDGNKEEISVLFLKEPNRSVWFFFFFLLIKNFVHEEWLSSNVYG